MNKIIIMSLLVILFSGCASTTKLSKKDSEYIAKIYVNDEVKIPDTAYYSGPEQGFGAVFGAIGALATSAVETKDDLIASYMDENNIDIGEISKQAVKSALLSAPSFADKTVVSNASEADTFFSVEVVTYGIGQTSGFSSVYRPLLGIKAKLTDSSNRVIWEDYEFISPMNDGVDTIEFKAYFKDPENMRSRYKKAAELVASFMVKDLEP